MKKLILYNTRSGASEKYAKWLAEEIAIAPQKFEDITDREIKTADKLYVISGTYGGQMPLVDFLKAHWQVIENKEIIAIAVGMVEETHWWSKITYRLIPRYIRKKIKFFKIQGWSPNQEKTLAGVKKENLERIIKS